MTLPLPDPVVVPKRLVGSAERLEEHRKSFESVQRNLDEIALQFPVHSQNLANATLVDALPSSPRNGMQVLYSPVVGVVWSLVFDQPAHESDNKGWVAIGGSPLYDEENSSTPGHTTNSTSYVSLTGGPSITLPVAGIWDVSIGMSAHLSANGGVGVMSYQIGGTGASDDECIRVLTSTDSTQLEGASVWGVRRKNIGAVTLATRYKTSGATVRFYRRRILAMPVRLAS